MQKPGKLHPNAPLVWPRLCTGVQHICAGSGQHAPLQQECPGAQHRLGPAGSGEHGTKLPEQGELEHVWVAAFTHVWFVGQHMPLPSGGPQYLPGGQHWLPFTQISPGEQQLTPQIADAKEQQRPLDSLAQFESLSQQVDPHFFSGKQHVLSLKQISSGSSQHTPLQRTWPSVQQCGPVLSV